MATSSTKVYNKSTGALATGYVPPHGYKFVASANKTACRTVNTATTVGLTAGDETGVETGSLVEGSGIAADATVSSTTAGFTKADCGTIDTDATVTLAITSGLAIGQKVSGTGIPAGAYILSIITDTSFELSANATATGTVTLTFGPYVTLSDAATATASVTLAFSAGATLDGDIVSILAGGRGRYSRKTELNSYKNDLGFTKSAATVDTSTTVTVVTSGISVGMRLTGTGIPANTYVTAVDSVAGTITISAAATATGTVTLTFVRIAAVVA
jgi:hypothetical protein